MKRLRFSLLLALVGSVSCALAANSPSSPVPRALSELPQCAQQCLHTAISNSACNPNDLNCTCSTESIQTQSSTCISQSCTIKEALFTKNATNTACGVPIRDRTQLFVNVTIVLGAITGVIVLVRLGSKAIMKTGFGLDDLFIFLTFACGLPSTAMNVVGTAGNGEGKDIWTLPFDSITRFGYFFYVMEIMYFLQLMLLKMSLLFFYLKIFPGPTRKLLWGTVIFNAVTGVAFAFLAAFQCSPVSYFWTGWDGEHEGSCLNRNAIGWANAAVSIALDLWMIGIPLWQLRGLSLHWKKKIGVAAMFIVGTFVTVISIVRLQFLVDLGTSQNPTFDQTDVSIWSTVEINVGIICACMPSLRLFLVRLFPVLGGSSYHTGGYENYGTGSKPQSRAWPKSRSKAAVETVKSRNAAPAHGGIELQQRYEVRYSEGDETGLVRQRELDMLAGGNVGDGSKSAKSTSEVSL